MRCADVTCQVYKCFLGLQKVKRPERDQQDDGGTKRKDKYENEGNKTGRCVTERERERTEVKKKKVSTPGQGHTHLNTHTHRKTGSYSIIHYTQWTGGNGCETQRTELHL